MTQKEFEALVVEENEKLAQVMVEESALKDEFERQAKDLRAIITRASSLLRDRNADIKHCRDRIETACREKRLRLLKAQMELEPKECITIHDAHQIRKKMIEATKKAVSGIPGVDAEKVNVNFEFLENGNCDWEVTLD